MSERRATAAKASNNRANTVRRNLFHQQLCRQPSSSNRGEDASTKPPRLENELDQSSDIVIRDEKGEFQISVAAALSPIQLLNDQDPSQIDAREEERDQQRLTDAIRNHQRDRNRTLSEPSELLEAVINNLKSKVAALIEDNWLYEAENEIVTR